MKYYLAAFFLFLLVTDVQSQKAQLRAGPMLGHVEMQEANIWLQMLGKADISIEYWKSGTRTSSKKIQVGKSSAHNSYIKHIKLTDLEPGTTYSYRIFIDGHETDFPYPLEFETQELWQWRRDPPDFKFALGSCLYINDPAYDRPGEPYGDDPEILNTIAKKNPDLMFWLGDNVYYREPDFYSKSRMDYRYRDARDTPEMQELLATSINLAIWDDHDYGPNNSDRTYRMKYESLEIFNRYWINPENGSLRDGGNYTRYKYSDVEFFLLDDRFFRAPNDLNDPGKPFLGDEQVQWLMESLVNSEATFKIILVGNQVMNTFSGDESFSKYEKEYGKFLDYLEDQKVEGVLFISGDTHYTQLLKTARDGLYPLYEFTVSPLSAGIHRVAESEKSYENPLHVDGTLVMNHNFGMVNVKGDKGNRKLVLESFGQSGIRNWRYEISQKQLELRD